MKPVNVIFIFSNERIHFLSAIFSIKRYPLNECTRSASGVSRKLAAFIYHLRKAARKDKIFNYLPVCLLLIKINVWVIAASRKT